MSSSVATKPTTTRGDGEVEIAKQSVIYKVIMTPVIFVSFLVSLAWVDFRYTLMRSHSHEDADRGRMPTWLHRILYRPSSYQYVKVKETSTKSQSGDKWGTYYHTKQRKLMRMEAEDAFNIRGHVLVVLALVSLAFTWGIWELSCWLLAYMTS